MDSNVSVVRMVVKRWNCTYLLLLFCLRNLGEGFFLELQILSIERKLLVTNCTCFAPMPNQLLNENSDFSSASSAFNGSGNDRLP